MEYSQFYEEYGQPFSGRKLKRLQAFLESMQLSYDQGVEYTVNLVDAQGEIAATGSLQQNVIKCVAVDDRHQGEGLSSRVVTLLMNHAIEQGNSHLFVFTKPKNIAMFSDLGFFPIIQTEDVLFMENVRDGIGRYVRSLQHPKDNGGVIGAAVMAVMLDWRLSLIFFIAGPLVALVLYLVMSRSVPFFKIIQRKLDRLSLITRENLSGVRVIRAFSRQKQEKKRFHEANTDQMEIAISVGRISALLNPLTSAIVNLAIVAVVWFGGVRVQAGGMTQGEIIAFVNYLNQILVAMIVVANLVVIFTKAFASAARVNEVLEMHSSIVNKTNQPVQPVQDSPKICFEQVRFCYPEAGADALSDINLTIRRGQTVGIIGGTGCGKSTLVNLIPRFYEVSSGSIRVDGTDVRSYPIPQLRKKIGMVPQRAVLFSGTLRENMQWNKQDAGDEEIWQALRVAQAEEFVRKLPDGLDTRILQGGENLSGGQKQRLTIARALVGSPEILVLDDSASALDFATDAALRRAIADLDQEMTVLIVSQRANTVRYADQIVVLDDGKAVGIGTHEQLLESCEEYQEIYWSQNERVLAKEEA